MYKRFQHECFIFKRNFIFDKYRRQKYYRNIQVEVYAVKENESWLVISVITKFF